MKGRPFILLYFLLGRTRAERIYLPPPVPDKGYCLCAIGSVVGNLQESLQGPQLCRSKRYTEGAALGGSQKCATVVCLREVAGRADRRDQKITSSHIG